MKKVEKRKIEIIELLRFVAMTEVFLIHYTQDYIHAGINFAIPVVSGKLGVAFFFMITAYLLVKTTKSDPKGFLRKKAVQLLPKYEVIILLVFLMAQIMPSLLHSIDASPINLLRSIFLIPYQTEGIAYVCPILPIAWTLVIQTAVFIMFRILMQFLKKPRLTGIIMAFITLALYITGCFLGTSNLLTFAYCRFYMLYFCAGFVIAFIEPYVTKNVPKIFCKPHKIPLPFCIILLIVFLALSCVYYESLLFFFINSFLFAGCIFIFSSLTMPDFIIMSGRISYSFYFLHYLVCKVFTRLIFKTDNYILFFVLLIVCYALSFISAWLYDILINKAVSFTCSKIKNKSIN